eukprot:gb/GECG01001649.1/.p1 GENE.gb/GECG01001649.1/~~gb/GECG01001649.1/.p1  ORF type:complete len:472 (+),score=84.97 gb/GECG01001649.1/:1-1416(+)
MRWRSMITVYTGKTIKEVAAEEVPPETFFRKLSKELEKVSRFYSEKEGWCHSTLQKLQDKVKQLREASAREQEWRRRVAESPQDEATEESGESGSGEFNSSIEQPTASARHGAIDSAVKEEVPHVDNSGGSEEKQSQSSSSGTESTSSGRVRHQEEYNAGSSDDEKDEMGENHFTLYIVAKKMLEDFRRELGFLQEYVDLNTTACRKIVKKFDKKTSEVTKLPKALPEFMDQFEDFRERGYLSNSFVEGLLSRVNAMLDVTSRCKPYNSKWSRTKVYTIGCFDLFHRGHANLLRALKEYGRFIVVGIHDDNSYYQLKNKYPIDVLEKRMENLRPYVDMTFVIPGTDPTPYLSAMVSPQDIEEQTAVYVRGSDMPNFPGREWIESAMPVHLIPRSEGVSSSLVRTLYHSDTKSKKEQKDDDNEGVMKAAFSDLDDAGKPIMKDETEETWEEALKTSVVDPALSVCQIVLGKT